MKRKGLFAIFIIVPIFFALPMGCSAVGIRTTEEPTYKLIRQDGPIEVREYDSYIIAETTISNSTYIEAGNKAFRKLFRYISGQNVKNEKVEMTAPVLAENSNQKGEKIEMTAPVLGEVTGDGWTYAFVLPLSYTMKTAPIPSDSSITLREIKSKTVAVITYNGSRSQKSYEEHTKELNNWIEKENYKSISTPRSAGYDPPWTVPNLRRNEVMVDIQKIE